MKHDFMKELDYLGVTARIKRLSDTFSANIKELYTANRFDIEPSWHLIFLFLRKEKQSTMSEIAEQLQLSQPAVTKMLTRIMKKGYIKSIPDKTDARKKIIQLTAKAERKLPQFESVWAKGQNTIREMLKTNPEFLNSLEKLETELMLKSFSERTLERDGNR